MLLKRRNAANTAWVVEGILFKQSLPQFDSGDIPLTNQGDIWVNGVGGHKWNGTAYEKSNFDRANILGAVSHDGGVPTGAILDRGVNVNGYYQRSADGTQICVKAVNVPEGTVASDDFIQIGESPWPIAFSIAPPYIQLTYVGGGGRLYN